MNTRLLKELQTLQLLVDLFVHLSNSVDQSVVDQLGRNLESIVTEFDRDSVTATTLEGLLTAIGSQLLKVKSAESNP